MFATRWQPFQMTGNDWRRLQGEVEQALEQLTGTAFRHFACSPFPPLNMWEEDEQFHVEAELPGLSLEELEIYVDVDNQLTLKGQRKSPDFENGKWHRQERKFGEFTRTLQLPQEADPDQVTAKYQLGVLHITLPKKAEVKPRRVEIKTS